ncbi:MAG: PAS domain-containing sensor histidine kinase [Lentisphaeria bacterium]|nr:PAS domain-containing sensor histidine kinase [Lentisphaeria bacterium]
MERTFEDNKSIKGNSQTLFASPERSSLEDLTTDAELFMSDYHLVSEVYDELPEMLLILNENRQIIYANKLFCQVLGVASPDKLLGKRPGEALGCVVAEEAPSGCGTGRECANCGAVAAILTALNGESAERECSVRNARGFYLELAVSSRPKSYNGHHFCLLIAREIGDAKRKVQLERIFFHDVLNLVWSLSGAFDLFKEDATLLTQPETICQLSSIINDIGDTIVNQRDLSLVQNGKFNVTMEELQASVFLDNVLKNVRNHEIALNKSVKLYIEPEDFIFVSSRTVLTRVLLNLLKNALEAEPCGSEVRLDAELQDNVVRISVKNPSVIDDEHKKMIFSRTFSTKGFGRGIGTYSVKLFTEQYLKGKVEFVSESGIGTVFTLVLPVCQADS